MPSVFGPIPVTYVENLMLDGENMMGLWDRSLRTIRIRTGLESDSEIQTVWHEWLHAILSDSGVSDVLKDKQEEAVVSAISTMLAKHVTLRVGKTPNKRHGI